MVQMTLQDYQFMLILDKEYNILFGGMVELLIKTYLLCLATK